MMEDSVGEVCSDKEKEQKLKTGQTEPQTELKFKTVFENANDCMFVLDMSGRILDVNKKAVDVFGRTKEELYGRHFSRVNAVSPKDVPRLAKGLAEVFAGRKTSLMLNVRSKMGQERTLESSGSLMKVGDKLSVLVIARDVTERMRMEEALKESEEKHRSLFELAPDGILLLDMKGKVTEVNEAFLGNTGFSKEEVVGKHFTRLPSTHNPNDVLQFLKLFSSFVRGKKIPPVQFPYRRKDGTTCWGEVHSALLKKGGKSVGIQVILRDITERKKAEASIRESQEKFERLFMGVPEAAVYVDSYVRVLNTNPRFTELFGYSQDESKGKVLDDLIVPVDRKEEARELAEKGRRGHVSFETTRKAKNGTLIPVSLSGAPLIVEGQHIGDLILYRDITRRKQSEQALKMSEDKYRTIFEKANDGIVYVDLSGKIVDINEKAAKIAGMKREEILGKSFTKLGLIGLKDVPKLLGRLAYRARGDDSPCSLELTVKNRKAEKRLLEINTSAVQRGLLHSGLLAVIRDVTEKKQAQEALRESEEKYRTEFEEAMDAIFVANAETGIMIDCNRAALELMGYEKSELIGKHQRILHPPQEVEGEFSRTYRQHLKEKEGQILETQIVTKNGEIKEVEVKANVFKLRGKRVIQGIFRDISDRKQWEEALLDAKEKWASLTENTDDIVMITDSKGVIQYVNRTVPPYTPEETVGRTAYEYVPREQHNVLEKSLRKVFQTGEPDSYEISSAIPKTCTMWFSTKIVPIQSHGKVTGAILVSTNITERKHMEDALKSQRNIAITLSGAKNLAEALSRLFDSLLEMKEFDSAAFYLLNKETGTLNMIAHRGLSNEFVGKQSHYNADSPYTKIVLAGKPLYQKISDFPPPIREDIQPSGILSVAAIPIRYEGEVIGHLNMASHTCEEIPVSTRHVLESISAQIGETILRTRMDEKLLESEEKLRQYSERLEDIVQKRTAELLESETRYSVLVEDASDGVAIMQDGKLAFSNKKGLEILGYREDEVVGYTIEKLVAPEYLSYAFELYAGRLKGQKTPSIAELELIAKNGERVPVEISGTLIEYQEHPAVLIILRDIRERKRMEMQRKELERLAAIGELATMVGHDLRNPLQSIENAIYCLKSEWAGKPPCPFPQETNDMLQVIDNSINYADKIIRDLQEFSSTRAPALEKADLNALVEETLSQVHRPDKIVLRTELDHLPEIIVDQDQMKRVFLNLSTNAIQAMEDKGTLVVSTRQVAGGFVEISFEDTGKGISNENMKRIFTPFFTTKAKGMGMGLPICKKFIDNHKGSIRVRSEEGKGTTFTVKIPVTQESGGGNH